MIAACPLLVSAFMKLKFKQFFPTYREYFIDASSNCTVELNNYWHNVGQLSPYLTPCAHAADCLLNNLPGTIQTNMGSAAVVLGFIPTTLAFFGPSLAEMAAVSLYNPLLAMLLSLASPAVNVQWLFRRDDIIEEIEKPVSLTFRKYQIWLDNHIQLKPVVASLKWFIAFAALANNVLNSVYLDLRTISGWRCGVLFMPLFWSLFAFVVHIFAMIAVRSRSYSTATSPLRYSWRHLPGSHDTWLSECLMWTGSLAATIQMLFGILDLSSLVFISALDALPIAIRYGISAIVCQIVLLSELASLRWRLKDDLAAYSNAHRHDSAPEEIELATKKQPSKNPHRRTNAIPTR